MDGPVFIWHRGRGYFDMIKELIAKININDTTNDGETALHIIAQEYETWPYINSRSLGKYKGIIELLYEYGIDSSIRDRNDNLARDLTTQEDLIQLFDSYDLNTVKNPGIE